MPEYQTLPQTNLILPNSCALALEQPIYDRQASFGLISASSSQPINAAHEDVHGVIFSGSGQVLQN